MRLFGHGRRLVAHGPVEADMRHSQPDTPTDELTRLLLDTTVEAHQITIEGHQRLGKLARALIDNNQRRSALP